MPIFIRFEFETIKKIQRGQDASALCARLPGGPDCDPFSIRASTKTNQDGLFASAGMSRPVGDALKQIGPWRCPKT
jgi:hypothetical protein